MQGDLEGGSGAVCSHPGDWPIREAFKLLLRERAGKQRVQNVVKPSPPLWLLGPLGPICLSEIQVKTTKFTGKHQK